MPHRDLYEVLLEEVYFQTRTTLIVGTLIGGGQKKNGERVALIETKNGDLFLGDLSHVHTVKSLHEV